MLPTKMHALTESINALRKYVQNLQVDFLNDILDIPNKLNEFTKALSVVTTKVEKLEGFKLEIPADLIVLPRHMSNTTSHIAKLKVMDAIQDIMKKVVASLHRFADAISSASQKAEPSGVPSARKASFHPVEGEKNTN
ncbi:hypothetical protein Tco_0381373 [Tanacetum coccineum]